MCRLAEFFYPYASIYLLKKTQFRHKLCYHSPTVFLGLAGGSYFSKVGDCIHLVNLLSICGAKKVLSVGAYLGTARDSMSDFFPSHPR